MLLGLIGFYLKLEDVHGTTIDEIGNLDGQESTADIPIWEIDSDVKDIRNRAALVRRYNVQANMPLDGKAKRNWVPASKFTASSERYWGRSTDVGTPGFRNKEKALPVQLSNFNAKRTAHHVKISWSTASELNNAGFYILRGDSPTGKFYRVSSLILGQGTTSEKTAYAWIDKRAQPKTGYFYRIQDVTLDGESQVIAQTRMKGFVDPKSKLAVRWAEMKR